MHFAIQKETLVRSLKDVSSALATRVVQPILSNILIECHDETTIRVRATDLDLAIESKASAVVYAKGAITLPGKKLLEITAKLPNDLVTFQVNKDTLETTVQCKRSKFNITGLPADDFPKLTDSRSVDGILMPADILRKSISQTAFAAASYDMGSILGGVYMLIEDGVFECAATDGSRLGHRREALNVSVPSARRGDAQTEGDTKAATATLERPSTVKAIVPARACLELVKLIDSQDGLAKASSKQSKEPVYQNQEIRIVLVEGQIIFETDAFYFSTRLISGEYPKYRELFPTECTYLGTISREELVSAIDRVAVMSDDRTHLIRMHFEGDNLQIMANTPDVGRAQEEMSINFEGQVLDIAVNVRYIFDVLQRLSTEQVQLEMTGSLKPIIIKGLGDENYNYLLMPVRFDSGVTKN